MSKKEGIVIDTNGKYANLLTPYGEFIRVNCNGKKPNIGEKFVGNEAVHRFFPVSAKNIDCGMYSICTGCLRCRQSLLQPFGHGFGEYKSTY